MSDAPNLKTPDELVRIQKLRDKLAGTDRDDHLDELDQWEKKTKNALIALSLKGHEGIAMLRAKAVEELHDIDKILRTNRPMGNGPEDCIAFANFTARLFARKELWEWFRDFFVTATEDLKTVHANLDEQERDEVESGW